MKKSIHSILKTKWIMLLLFSLLMLPACIDDPEVNAIPDPPDHLLEANQILIEPTGGTFEINALGIQLSVPANAVQQATHGSFDKLNLTNNNELSIESEILLMHPQDLVFQEPVKVTLYYYNWLCEPSTMDEDCMAVFHLPDFYMEEPENPLNYNVLEKLNNCCVNVAQESVTGETQKLGAFLIAHRDPAE